MMEAAPSAAFIVPEAEFLLELLVVALDAPAQLGEIDQAVERDVVRKGGEPVFGWLALALGPLDQQPLFRSALGELVIAMGDANPHPGEARGQPIGRAFAPGDHAPGPLGQAKRQLLGRDQGMEQRRMHRPEHGDPLGRGEQA